MSDSKGCACSGVPTLIFACSGAADVGAVADQAARQMTRDGQGKMYCLAGIGGKVSGILATTEAADKILAMDGCPLNCARKSLENAGFKQFAHVQLSDLGLYKGKSPVTPEHVRQVIAAGVKALAELPAATASDESCNDR